MLQNIVLLHLIGLSIEGSLFFKNTSYYDDTILLFERTPNINEYHYQDCIVGGSKDERSFVYSNMMYHVHISSHGKPAHHIPMVQVQ